jgi:hypothetical protein
MEKLSRNQLPDSSSSPPLSAIFQAFDDEAMSDLPSCVYANPHHHHHHHHHQLVSQHLPTVNNLNASSLSPTPNGSNLKLNVNSFRQIQQHFLQHEMSENPPTLASSSNNAGNFSSQVKTHRQGGAIRERKRTVRSAPNGYI